MSIFALVYLSVLAFLACRLKRHVPLVAHLEGIPGYLGALGLTLFLCNWANFAAYAILGWGRVYDLVTWVVPVGAIFFWSRFSRDASGQLPAFSWRNAWLADRGRRGAFWFLTVFVLLRFCLGLAVDGQGNVWANFNFVDTAFHLSIANAFLQAPHFPPVDLDMAPFPLKYHFLADFFLAHLQRLGLSALRSVWMLNALAALVAVGTLWSVLERWLNLPARWVLLAAVLFLFLNPALLNLVHYWALRPEFFDPTRPFDGIIRFPYFNFEYSLANLFEPQRGLLFSFPVVLLVIDALFGEEDHEAKRPENRSWRWPFVLICLMPFGHIVSFAVLGVLFLPTLWRNRRDFSLLAQWWIGPALIAVLQLIYLRFYGPPASPTFSGWDAMTRIPLNDFETLPVPLQFVAFWVFANGDYLLWGGGFAVAALISHSLNPSLPNRLAAFLGRWRWYFAVTVGVFLLINVGRYSSAWGDSNKFVMFLNLGLSLVIALGASQWVERRGAWRSTLLWSVLMVLCLATPVCGFFTDVVSARHGKILMFHPHGRAAAAWLKKYPPGGGCVLTAAYHTFHFVTSLAGVRTPAGIYADSNPYRQPGREKVTRRIYEEADWSLLASLNVSQVCLSEAERRSYKLHPEWQRRMQSGEGVLFHSGAPDDYYSVYIFDAAALAKSGAGRPLAAP